MICSEAVKGGRPQIALKSIELIYYMHIWIYIQDIDVCNCVRVCDCVRACVLCCVCV